MLEAKRNLETAEVVQVAFEAVSLLVIGVLQLNEAGVLFRSYRDGQHLMLSPESSVQAQKVFTS